MRGVEFIIDVVCGGNRWLMNGIERGYRKRRCAMQAVTVQECLTFFVSVAVIAYLWLQ
jgi:hypothetical protein